jgi:hypothetical protein
MQKILVHSKGSINVSNYHFQKKKKKLRKRIVSKNTKFVMKNRGDILFFLNKRKFSKKEVEKASSSTWNKYVTPVIHQDGA